MAVVPMGLSCTDSVSDAKLYLLVAWIGHFSLFPLLFEAREEPYKVVFFAAHSLLAYVCLDTYHRRRQRMAGRPPTGIHFATGEKIYISGLGVIHMFVSFLHPRLFRRADGSVILPFLPLMVMSVYCAVGMVYTWVLTLRRYYIRDALVARVSPKQKKT